MGDNLQFDIPHFVCRVLASTCLPNNTPRDNFRTIRDMHRETGQLFGPAKLSNFRVSQEFFSNRKILEQFFWLNGQWTRHTRTRDISDCAICDLFVSSCAFFKKRYQAIELFRLSLAWKSSSAQFRIFNLSVLIQPWLILYFISVLSSLGQWGKGEFFSFKFYLVFCIVVFFRAGLASLFPRRFVPRKGF